jgi:hypothetical protein
MEKHSLRFQGICLPEIYSFHGFVSSWVKILKNVLTEQIKGVRRPQEICTSLLCHSTFTFQIF